MLKAILHRVHPFPSFGFTAGVSTIEATKMPLPFFLDVYWNIFEGEEALEILS